MVHTDIPESPWFVVESDDKRRARLNMIAHLLSTLDYHEVDQPDHEAAEAAQVIRLRTAATQQRAVRPGLRQHAHGAASMTTSMSTSGHDASSLGAAGDDGMTIGGSMRWASIGRSSGSARCGPSSSTNRHRRGTLRTPIG